jgi:threonyl-tRNA synthetase
LARCLQNQGVEYRINPGEGAFYGPKIDFSVRDALRREWQLATIQLDFSMPERFELTYVTQTGTEARPVMIHRAILGSIERFMGILIEHTGGFLPLWLAPIQVRALPVTERHNPYAQTVVEQINGAGMRAELDGRNEKLSYKIREVQVAKIPYALVIGDREVTEQTVSPRRFGGENLKAMALKEFIDLVCVEAKKEMPLPAA